MARSTVKFSRLADGSWGIRVDAYPLAKVSEGDKLTATKRSGEQVEVTVDKIVRTERDGKVVYCSIVRKKGSFKKPVRRTTRRITHDDAEYARGVNDTRQAQMMGPAGSAAREAAYMDMERQWAREGFDG